MCYNLAMSESSSKPSDAASPSKKLDEQSFKLGWEACREKVLTILDYYLQWKVHPNTNQDQVLEEMRTRLSQLHSDETG